MHSNALTRRSLLQGLAGVAAATVARPLAAQQAPPPSIQAKKLADRLWVLTGDGGNVAVLTSADGVFMVDGGVPDQADNLAQAIAAQVSKKPVTVLFDTHWHFDHVGSNVKLGHSGAKIIGHDNVKTRLSSKQTMEMLNRTFEPLPAEGLPGVTFHEAGSLTFGTDKVQYTPVEPAHTDGDTFVFFPSANVLHTGDLLFNGFYPVIDYSSKGWIGGMAAAAGQMADAIDDKTVVIPGHGPIGTRADVTASRDMLQTMQGRFAAFAKDGKSVEEVAALAPSKDFDAKWGNGFFKPDSWVKVAYTSVLRHNQQS